MAFEIILKHLKLLFIPCEENNYRPRFLAGRILVCFILFLLLLKIILVSNLIYFPRSAFFAELSSSSLIDMVNQERVSSNLLSLKENSQLDKAAYLKAKDMMDKGYFSHQSPEGKTPWYWIKGEDYNYQSAGENLAIGFLDSKEVFDAWLDSPSHKANILNRGFKEIGIAVLKGNFNGNETYVVVQMFGSPEVKAEKIATKEPVKINTTPKIEVKTAQPLPEKKGMAEVPAPEQKKTAEIPKEDAKSNLDQTVLSAVAPEAESNNSMGFNLFQFFTIKYNDILQKIILYSLLLLIIASMLNIFIKFEIQHKDLIFKTIIFIGALALFAIMNQSVILHLIPHHLIVD